MSKKEKTPAKFQIENWMVQQPDTAFPPYCANKGEKSFPNKYKDLKLALVSVHNIVEKGALLKSITNWKNDVKRQINALEGQETPESVIERKQLTKLLERDPAIYLNCHGVGHVDKVIEKVSEILQHFKPEERLKSYEAFILLCAIQIHDIGNVFGRENHEKALVSIFMDKAKTIIPDTPTKALIAKIAQVHSGKICGDKDTISQSNLKTRNTLFNEEIRETLIAALLRFADELADDSSRADIQALEMDQISEESLIYHEYSKSLHTVTIKHNDINNTLYLLLEYCVEFSLVTKEFSKEGKPTFLLDEIFYRTIKMEQERRYCMRFFSQYLHLYEIKVRIEIVSAFDLINPEEISYTLAENGYPSNNGITIDCQNNTAQKVIDSLQQKGWRLSNE